MPKRQSFTDKLQGKYYVKEDGCWIWTASSRHGYPMLWMGRKEHRVHRMMYAHTYGPLHPDSLVMHLCMNKACINPEHLETGTHAENGRFPDNAKLTWDDVHFIRNNPANLHIKVLSELVGISLSHCYAIRNGGRWA